MCVVVGCIPYVDQPDDSPSATPTPLIGRFLSGSHPTASCACNGDIAPLAGDGRIDSADTTQLDLCVLVGGGLTACDVNCDGQYSMADLDVMMCIGQQRGQNCCAAMGACVQQDGACVDDTVLTCNGCNTRDICPVRDGATYYGGQRCEHITVRAPQNDRCENALPLDIGSRQVNTSGSFTVGTESNCDASPVFNDVWFTYQARATGQVTIEACENESNSNTIVSVYDSQPMSNGKYMCPEFGQVPVACSTSGCGVSPYGATAEFHTLAGRYYVVQLATKLPTSPAVFQLSVSESPSLLCGDGVTQSPEQCDDANAIDGDGCNSACVMESAGGLTCTTARDCINGPEDNACNCPRCTGGFCEYYCVGTGNTNCVGIQFGTCLDDILYTLSGFASGIEICLNADTAPCDGDGVVNIDDILRVLQTFYGYEPCNCAHLEGIPPGC